jgi:3'-5' exoribonuclease
MGLTAPKPTLAAGNVESGDHNAAVKTTFVADLEPNQTVTTYLLVQSKETRAKKTGEPYLSLRLADRSGRLDAKMWDGVGEVMSTFERDDVIKVQGIVQVYRDRLQMTIQRLRRADDSEIEIADYLPRTKRDIDEMFAAVRATTEQMSNPHLCALLSAFLDDEAIAAKFRKAPAAKSLHHAFVGGLLEHVVSLLNLARLCASNYSFIDLDLLQTGVILHDMGKIEELSYSRGFGYTSEGQLLGHIVIVLRLLDEKCRQIPGFPPRLKMLVEHMILSHHGKYEFGSPKLPMFPEALMLHYIDDLDSKLESMRAALAEDSHAEDEWTAYNPALERTLLDKNRFLAGPTSAPSPRAGAAPRIDGAGEQADSETKPRQGTLGLLGEKLQSALKKREEHD